MITPIKVNEAKAGLTLLLDDAGVRGPVDRYLLLEPNIAEAWFVQLQRAGLADGLDVWDVIAGKDALIADLLWQFPTGAGKTNPALLRTSPALLGATRP